MSDFNFDLDLVPESVDAPRGVQDLTFDGLLSSALKVDSDGGQTGCGGRLWPAGELLSRYLIRYPPPSNCRMIELGSGTGLAGLALAAGHKTKKPGEFKVYITDQTNMLPLMQRNIELNELQPFVEATELDWGQPLPQYAHDIDLILAADCVYLESAFPLLEKTLLDLTQAKPIPILMAYKKRRKADRHFFKAIKKHFEVTEISDYPEYDAFHKDNVHLFSMKRK